MALKQKKMKQVLAAVKEVNWKWATFMFNTVTFLAYGLDEHNFASDPRLLSNERDTIRYSSILLGIAGVHYSVLDVSKLSVESEILIRYSDWLLTTPLLLKTLGAFYQFPAAVTNELVIYNVLMIAFGFLYELSGNHLYWTVGTAAYLLIVYRLNQALAGRDKTLFYRYFLFGWSMYGLVSLLPVEKRTLPYNVLDTYNKLVFAMDIRRRIVENIANRPAGPAGPVPG
uniref:Uncharacterized protein n=1 Tax=viral metagenome TaxID=1070528 RepID=A0A6C0BP95_9ZZZZ